MKYRWLPAPAQPQLASQLAAELGLSPLLAQCLLNRGLLEPAAIRDFLEPRLKHLADPFLLPNMDAAVQRLLRARQAGEAVVIFGDYDVDGVTSTTVLREVLGQLGWQVQSYLPDRLAEGYGLSREAVEHCLERSPATVLLAVDCGSNARDTIAWLQQRGIDVLVFDHHQVCSPAPPACALVNPQLTGRFTELCSVGLAFKLAHALLKRAREQGLPGAAEFDLRPLLDLVALGTIADLVPLTGENRILVSAGLERLQTTRRPGLAALKQVAQCPPQLGTYEVGFQLAPRLNAAGRLETAEAALHLLLATDLSQAVPLARRLDAQNRERQRIEKQIVEEVTALVRAKFDAQRDYVIVEGHSLWHIGVVGIVASRVLQQFYRPTIIVGGDGEHWRGSGRSIAGFDLAAALRECTDLLVRHGGHAMAAGLTIANSNLESFRTRLNELARRTLQPEALLPPLRLDGELGLTELSLECLEHLERLKPLGQGNPSVQLLARNLRLQGPPQRIGADKQHLKLWVTDGTTVCEAVWWNAAQQTPPPERFDLAFAPQVNHYNGRRTVELKVLDWASPT